LYQREAEEQCVTKDFWRIVGGFSLLIPGFLTLIVLPEVGVPLALLGTRLLGDRFKWAKSLNGRIDRGWAKMKLRLKKFRGK
jgi:hypothetical protein